MLLGQPHHCPENQQERAGVVPVEPQRGSLPAALEHYPRQHPLTALYQPGGEICAIGEHRGIRDKNHTRSGHNHESRPTSLHHAP